jgi:hypothetical protein
MTSRTQGTRLKRQGAHIVGVLVALLAARSVPAQSSGSTLLRQLYGDVAIEVQRSDASTLRIAAADSSRSVIVTVNASDVLHWADSAKRVLTGPVRPTQRRGRLQAVLEEPGTSSGSIVLSRSIEGADTVIALLVVDGDFEQIHGRLDAENAAAFVAALRRAASRLLGATRPRKPDDRR